MLPADFKGYQCPRCSSVRENEFSTPSAIEIHYTCGTVLKAIKPKDDYKWSKEIIFRCKSPFNYNKPYGY